MVTRKELEAHRCWEPTDKVAGDAETTAFRRRARLHQALWREARGLPEGTQPSRPRPGVTPRPLGSRLDLEHARRTGANFLSDSARRAVQERIEQPEHGQTLMTDRLYADLLSSMPMCFNLFGPLWAEPDLAASLLRAWCGEAAAEVAAVRFEWSPGRLQPGRFLENRTSFDAAFDLRLGDGARATIGVETKYHERCAGEAAPGAARLERYRVVAERSGAFLPGAVDAIVGGPLQQIWLDHLLALSLLQDREQPRRWVKFVLVHPGKNPSYARAATDYRGWLADSSTFEVMTLEELLAVAALPAPIEAAFRQRYLWELD